MISVVFNHDKEKNHFNEGANHRPVDKVSSLQTRNKKTILNTYQLAPRKSIVLADISPQEKSYILIARSQNLDSQVYGGSSPYDSASLQQ